MKTTNTATTGDPMTPIPTVTDEQIIALRDEAAAAGDYAMSNICEGALNPEESRTARAIYRAECARVIDAARAMDDEVTP